MAKFRVRNLLGKVPVLDGMRLSFLAAFCHHGSAFMDRSYPIMRCIPDETRQLLESNKPVIFAVHHGRMIGLLRMLTTRKELSVLVSQSRDGEIIGRAIHSLGFTVARGSEKRGAVQGGMQMVKAAEAGQHLVIMVDGPRGPTCTVKNGIIKMAELTGLPIVPMIASSRKAWYMWGWDSFMATCWGSPILHVFGKPLYVDRDSVTDNDRLEFQRAALEETLIRIRNQADDYWEMIKTA